MSRISGKDTKPEVLVRKYLFSKGFRYRKNDIRLPGKPDIVLAKYKTVIFVNGCFLARARRMSLLCFGQITMLNFWRAKISGTIERDKKTYSQLNQLGWHVIVIWECEFEKECCGSAPWRINRRNTRCSPNQDGELLRKTKSFMVQGNEHNLYRSNSALKCELSGTSG